MCVWNTEQENTRRSKQRWKEDPALVPLFPWARAMQACSQHIHCRPKEKAKNAETKTPNINTIAPTTHQPTLQHIHTPNLRKHQDTTQFEQKPHSRTNRTSCASARTFAATLLNSVTTAKHSRTTQKWHQRKNEKNHFQLPTSPPRCENLVIEDCASRTCSSQPVRADAQPDREMKQHHLRVSRTWQYKGVEKGTFATSTGTPSHVLEFAPKWPEYMMHGLICETNISWPGMTLCWRADLKLLQTHWCHLGSRNWQSLRRNINAERDDSRTSGFETLVFSLCSKKVLPTKWAAWKNNQRLQMATDPWHKFPRALREGLTTD